MNKIIVQLDISPLKSGHNGRGVGTYTRELKRALSEIDSPIQINFSSELSSPYPNLIHYPYFDLFFQTLPILKKTKTVVTIHDLIPLKFPQFFPVGMKGKFKFLIQKLAVINVDSIITDSHASKIDIVKYLNFEENKINVIPLSASDEFSPMKKNFIDKLLKKYNLPKEFCLYVGDINYNKNLPFLINAFSKFKKLPLVIVTRSSLEKVGEFQTDMAVSAIKTALGEAGENIIFLKVDSQSELNALYSQCTCYIQPSLAEGFGLPILEAYKSGTVVISSDQSSLPEVAKNAAFYFNPRDLNSLLKKLDQVVNLKTSERQKIVEKGIKIAHDFSWNKTAQETLKVYQQVLEL